MVVIKKVVKGGYISNNNIKKKKSHPFPKSPKSPKSLILKSPLSKKKL